jgi:hypothetical protein
LNGKSSKKGINLDYFFHRSSMPLFCGISAISKPQSKQAQKTRMIFFITASAKARFCGCFAAFRPWHGYCYYLCSQ